MMKVSKKSDFVSLRMTYEEYEAFRKILKIVEDPNLSIRVNKDYGGKQDVPKTNTKTSKIEP